MSEKGRKRSFPLSKKQDAINDFNKGSKIAEIARKFNVNESTVRGRIKKQDQIKEISNSTNLSLSAKRRCIGGGKKPSFPDIEDEVFQWVLESNNLGLVVKDKFIIAKAKEIRDEKLMTFRETVDPECENELLKQEIEALEKFQASTCWCNRFKNRFRLVSRRITSSRKLPDDYKTIVNSFLTSTQMLIKDLKIKPENIINFDQVPRYFEQSAGSTITTKSTKDVFIRKASSAHKRFTFTPTISSSGEFLNCHVLFSNLKNKPKVADGVMVHVNKTGMWNKDILKDWMTNVILKRHQTSLFKEPVLILLDSYGTHINFVQEHEFFYRRRNIHFKIIPKSEFQKNFIKNLMGLSC